MNIKLNISILVFAVFFSIIVRAEYRPDFGCEGGVFGVTLPKTYPEVLAMGIVISNKIDRTIDYGKYKVDFRTLKYDGLILSVVTFSNDKNKYMFGGANIKKSKWKLAKNVRVGANVDTIRRHLKDKMAADSGNIHIGGDTANLYISVFGGKITSIDYDCHTG